MSTYCGANCENCLSAKECKGCVESQGSPFGGRCVAAEYIKQSGLEAYKAFKAQLLGEINVLLRAENIPEARELYELSGKIVNLEYTLPGGARVRFLDDRNIYLGIQIELGDTGLCCGVVADSGFILVSRYGADGRDAELVMYKQR